jgi:Fibronectin type III domain
MLGNSSRGLSLINRPGVVAAAALIAALPGLAGGTALAAPGPAATAAAAARVTPATAQDTPLPGAAFFSCYQGNASGGSYTVPANATAVTIVAWGAAGEDVPGASGGKGAAVTATVPVTGGETLTATPGCDGGLVVPFIGQSPSQGWSQGEEGGRVGGAEGDGDGGVGGLGGASSGVTASGSGTPLVVAGGGGGGGGAGEVASSGGNGGSGSQKGDNGGHGTGTHHANGGTGGTASGNGNGSGTIGGNGYGVAGGGGGGGGGGGYQGGTGGAGGQCLDCGGGGGGGGSSFVTSSATSSKITAGGAAEGNGFIVIAPVLAGLPAPSTTIFSCSGGAQQTYVVPAATYSVSAMAMGAQGGDSGSTDGGPGWGDEATAAIAVGPGDTLGVTAGCPGSEPGVVSGGSGGAGIANGGSGGYGPFGSGGGGGGASGVQVVSSLFYSPGARLVAAGGGGAGSGTDSAVGGAGGWNFTSGGAGEQGENGIIGNIGGGAGGSPGGNGSNTGGSGTGSSYAAGGGGGGYPGGNGGTGDTSSGGGGGEGADYFDPATTSNTSSSAGSGSLNGVVVLVAEPFGVPGAPTGTTATAGVNQASVSWEPPALDGDTPVTSYTVTSKPASAGSPLVTTSTSAVLTNLTPGTPYTFTVKATNLAGTGPASAPSSPVVPYRVPAAPVISSATAGNGAATVSFTPATADTRLGNPITGYTVTARPGVNVTTGPGITQNGTGSPITVTGLTNGQLYTVTVDASNAAGTGPQSKGFVVEPDTLPGAPVTVTAANATQPGDTTGTATVSWQPPASNGGSPIISYTAVSSPGGITAVTNSGQSSVPVTGLTIGTSYTFTVYATNAVGSGPSSAASNAVTPTPVGTPSPPQVPGAATLDQSAYVSCLPPATDGSTPIVSYTVTSSPGGITATGSSCPILVTGLTDGTSYTFTVTATNSAGGTSQPSQPTSPITPHPPSGPPPANDNFAHAQVITGTSGSVSGTNVGATLEPGEQNIQDNAGGASVWYKWTVPANGTYDIDTCSANPGVVGNIGLFVGNSVSTANEIPPGPSSGLCPDNPDGSGEAGSTIIANLSAGETVYIKFDGVNENGSNANPPYEGPFTLEWSEQS